jgi:aspartyl-tRNA(Asn)/glutamyl-tRNA(Gln) amidotransferase subunit C
MRPEISEALVRRVAHLARLSLTSDEIAVFTQQFQDILGYIEKLEQVDTTDVEPMTHAMALQNVLREDEPRPSLDPEAALQNAPARHGTHIRVPPVLDGGGA